MWPIVMCAVLLVKPFLKGISELLLLGLKSRKDILLSDLSELPSCSELGVNNSMFLAVPDRNSIPLAGFIYSSKQKFIP